MYNTVRHCRYLLDEVLKVFCRNKHSVGPNCPMETAHRALNTHNPCTVQNWIMCTPLIIYSLEACHVQAVQCTVYSPCAVKNGIIVLLVIYSLGTCHVQAVQCTLHVLYYILYFVGPILLWDLKHRPALAKNAHSFYFYNCTVEAENSCVKNTEGSTLPLLL